MPQATEDCRGLNDRPPASCLILTPDYAPSVGGLQILCQRLAETVSALDVEVVTAISGANPGSLGARLRSTTVSRHLSRPALRNTAGNAFGLWRAFVTRPQVLLSMHVTMSPAAIVSRRTCGIPYVQYVHAKEIGARPWLDRQALTRADAVIAVSEHSRMLAVNAGASAARVKVIPPGVDLPAPDDHPKSTVPTLVTVARMDDHHKGHDIILRALPTILAAVPEVRWICIGDGKLRAGYEQFARQLGVADHVRFLGRVSDDERDRWLRRSHAFVMPGRAGADGSEGFGIAYLEASARATAVIGPRVGGALDAVADGLSGVLVAPNDPLALAKAAIDLLCNHEQRHRLETGGRIWAEQHSWPLIAAQVEGVLLDIVSSRI
jgi:glycosyltransferase involved in cell wall biosynthesis